jgi:hypothetical protein
MNSANQHTSEIHPKHGHASLACTLILFLVSLTSGDVHAQVTGKTASTPPVAQEDVQTQAKRLEIRASQNTGAALEILRELLKFSGGGDVALRNAAAKTESTIKKIKADSASFEADLKKARDQLQKGREELQKIEGSADIVAAYLRDRVEPLSKNLSQSEAVSRTSLNVLDTTARKIAEWQKVFGTFSDIMGREDAVKKIKDLIEKEVAELSKK